MRKFTKALSLCCMAAFIMLATTGCGKMTVEKLMEKMTVATAGKEVASMDCDLVLEASYSMEMMGMNISIPFNVDMDMTESMQKDPHTVYVEGHMIADLLGEKIDSDLKTYTLIEGDEIVTYTYEEISDAWTREVSPVTPEEYEQSMIDMSMLVSEDPESIILEEETSIVNDQEAYVLHLEITGENMEGLFEELGSSVDDMMDLSEVDMSDISIPTVCYVDTETFLPVKMEMSIEGMDAFLNQLFEQAMGSEELMAEAGIEEDMAFTVEVPKCEAVMTNISFDEPKIPELPQEALDQAELAEKLAASGDSLPDGRHLLKYLNSAVAIYNFRDFTLDTFEEGYAEYYTNDEMQTVIVTAITSSDADLIIEETVAQYEALFESMGMSMEALSAPEMVSTHLGDVEVYSITSDGIVIYYTIIPVKGMDLFVVAVDSSDTWENAADIIIPFADAVSPVTLEDFEA